jgi:hypothetical protein
VDDSNGGANKWHGGTTLYMRVDLDVEGQSMVSERFVSILDLYIQER